MIEFLCLLDVFYPYYHKIFDWTFKNLFHLAELEIRIDKANEI